MNLWVKTLLLLGVLVFPLAEHGVAQENGVRPRSARAGRRAPQVDVLRVPPDCARTLPRQDRRQVQLPAQA